jgi:hypothetical protein
MKNILIGILGVALLGETAYLVNGKLKDKQGPEIGAKMAAPLMSYSSTSLNTEAGTLPISSDTAKLCQDAYKMNSRALLTSVSEQDEILEGFMLDMANMNDLLSLNPAKLYIALGVRPQDLNQPDSLQYFTQFIYGLNEDLEIIEVEDKPLVYERVLSCPEHCIKK